MFDMREVAEWLFRPPPPRTKWQRFKDKAVDIAIFVGFGLWTVEGILGLYFTVRWITGI
jgi:hypothetical protein